MTSDTPSAVLPMTERTRVRRLPARGVFDRAAIYAILDEAFVCHVAFAVDGQPYAIPTGYARLEDALYLHGSAASRMVRQLSAGLEVCVTVTLLDGLVLARSAFHHSVNYRSAVVLGRARLVTDLEEKRAALRQFTNHVVPGRWDELRPITDQEIKATAVLALPIEEASAKVRTGPPRDDDDDLAWPVWAGVVPLATIHGEPIPDAHLLPSVTSFDVDRLRNRAQRQSPAATNAAQ
jgi:nitroimidazol reductase NimA-like FMN-containing flavoprotein (pyridoxamine 5'-phosphate oxidase superfamily)